MAFAPVPWFLLRRWPAAFVRASVLTIVLGMTLGQGLEPLNEVILYQVGVEPFTNPVRWRVFAEFLAAGILVSVGSAVAAGRFGNGGPAAIRRVA